MKTIAHVVDATKRVTDFIQTYNKTPNFVRVDKENIEPAPFNRMLAATVLEIQNKSNRNILNLPVQPAPAPQSTLKEGQIELTGYIDVARRAYIFVQEKKTWPNFITSKRGNISPDQFMDMYSRVLNFYKDKNVLPRFVYTTSLTPLPPVKPVTVPDNVKEYLFETRNCQVNHPTIKSLANQLNTPRSMFNWVRDKIGYDYYYNTRFGALNTIKQSIANCCDQSHLLVALLRAKGYPARYKHVRANYGMNVYGHVYVEAYLDGKWHGLDPSSSRNTFESINRWKLVSVLNNYRELPF